MAGHEGPICSASIAVMGNFTQTPDTLCPKEIQLAEIQYQRMTICEAGPGVVGQVMDVGSVQLAGGGNHGCAIKCLGVQPHAITAEMIAVARPPSHREICIVNSTH